MSAGSAGTVGIVGVGILGRGDDPAIARHPIEARAVEARTALGCGTAASRWEGRHSVSFALPAASANAPLWRVQRCRLRAAQAMASCRRSEPVSPRPAELAAARFLAAGFLRLAGRVFLPRAVVLELFFEELFRADAFFEELFRADVFFEVFFRAAFLVVFLAIPLPLVFTTR